MLQRLKFGAFGLNISAVSTRLTLRRSKTNRLLSAEHNCRLFRRIHTFRSFSIVIGPTPQLQFLYIEVLFINFILRLNFLTLLLHVLISPTIILESSATVDNIYFTISISSKRCKLGFHKVKTYGEYILHFTLL